MFLDQFSDVLIIILLVSAAISVLLGEVTDAIIIGIIVILNATLSVVQEFKAEKSLDALKKMTVPEALVLRGGRQKKIKSTQLVPGDIVFLEAGERIPADLRLFEVTELGIQEAVLTGESEPVEKNDRELTSQGEVSLGDRFNMAYTGTTIVTGRGKGIVVGTGMNTEIGQIADVAGTTKRVNASAKKLNQVGKTGIIILAIIIVVVLLATGGNSFLICSLPVFPWRLPQFRRVTGGCHYSACFRRTTDD